MRSLLFVVTNVALAAAWAGATRSQPAPGDAVRASSSSAGSAASDAPSESAGTREAVPIVDAHGAMRSFYDRLGAVQRQERGAIARIAFYGDSTNGADRVTSALRRKMQHLFGDSGKGFVPATPGWDVQHHQDVQWDTNGAWHTWVVNRQNGPGQRYGLAGVLSESRSRSARTTIATIDQGPVGRSVGRFRVFYQRFPQGGALSVTVDGVEREAVPTGSETVVDRVLDIAVPDGPHALSLGPMDERPIRLYGVALERDRPGVIVDGLMLVGAFTRVLGQFERDHWRAQLAAREPDLLVFWFGGNDVTSRTTGFSRERYVQDFATSVRTARSGRPEASCLIVSLLDAAEAVDGRIRSLDRVPRVVDAQRQAADQSECAFYNLFEAAGGRNAMARWRHRRLASGDYRHLTRLGAEEVGRLLYEAMIAGLAAHSARASAAGP